MKFILGNGLKAKDMEKGSEKGDWMKFILDYGQKIKLKELVNYSKVMEIDTLENFTTIKRKV